MNVSPTVIVPFIELVIPCAGGVGADVLAPVAFKNKGGTGLPAATRDRPPVPELGHCEDTDMVEIRMPRYTQYASGCEYISE